MTQVEFVHGTPSLPEFGDMFGGWLTEHGGRMFLVDCGVGSGGPTLAERLKSRLGSRPLDYVLLTHIHLDHAGGLGDIVRAWPGVKILTHAKGLPHLVAPERLWAGTNEVMGERVGAMYGQPTPMEAARLIPHTECDIPGLRIIETPGHAPHHLSFRLGETLFAGEAAGCPEIIKGKLCLSPSTPPRFFPDVTLASVALLQAEPDAPAYFGHTHYPIPLYECLTARVEQLAFWDEFLRRPEWAQREGEDFAAYLTRLTDAMFVHDPYYLPEADIPPADLWRHRYFIGNNLKGIMEYQQREAQAPADAG
ncbi:MAG: MBL fold metallo-hydrolase [Candidatus Adiutrix sp.]|jgi:glyoxylase-like metal-dependent hydrolase (beta-lactamase superfamily II)|nr:MBL fold metallo-hydrolase [Candidatus Adiutrix sp.]